jgi:hypothetical protein
MSIELKQLDEEEEEGEEGEEETRDDLTRDRCIHPSFDLTRDGCIHPSFHLSSLGRTFQACGCNTAGIVLLDLPSDKIKVFGII